MNMAYKRHKKNLAGFCAVLLVNLLSAWFLWISVHAADDSTCARVKIEIKQEMTLERQAFDAEMRIINGLSNISLENVNITVNFLDEQRRPVLASSDPDNTSALFFIRLSSMGDISAVSGSGTVAATSTADIHWLIIPAPGAANGLPQGTLYYVGATLTYTVGGEEHVTEVTPDYIYVKPLPKITLDYFLPADVYGDDAFTPEIEPPVPFNLGVRVSNNGQGVARKLKINSAQPKIVDNQQGLLIGFVIEGSEVNGNPAASSLLADFGDIQPNASALARWIMTCTLSGRFVEFKADYTHSDELGGELTSLLEDPITHLLVRDVLVDLPGRDRIRDFLAVDGAGSYTVYESEKIDTPVTNPSASSNLTGSGSQYTLTTPVTAGFMVVKLSDPNGGQKTVKEVIRSDGKRIKPENAWLAKTRVGSQPWQHFFYLFDSNTTGSYTVSFGEAAVAHAPVLEFVPDRTGLEGESLSFVVQASDPDGTIPKLSAAPLPAGASFTEQGNGIGAFAWTPAVGQAGRYEITFAASDGVMEDRKRMRIIVNSILDTDGDGILDEWERRYFGDLSHEGSGDSDGDGVTDLAEFLAETDPTKANRAPTVPEFNTPADGTEVGTLTPGIIIQNSTDPDADPLTYEFELYSDERLSDLVAAAADVPQGQATTAWAVPAKLSDNTWYVVRVRASDKASLTKWAYSRFFVNTENDPPGPFHISRPEDGSQAASLRPVLEVTNSSDKDEDPLAYTFEVYADSSMVNRIGSATVPQGKNGSTSCQVTTPLADNTSYYWRVIAADEHGLQAATSLASFRVNISNSAPQAPVISSPGLGSEVNAQEADLVVANAIDSNGNPLTYTFELDKVHTFDSPALQVFADLAEGSGTTTLHVTNLEDNTRYFWRVRASDGLAESAWASANFFVNTANDPPSAPTIRNPGQGAWVDSRRPLLEVNPSLDPDNDTLTYRFEVYSDISLINLVAWGKSALPQWRLSIHLTDHAWHYWRVKAEDGHEAASEWTTPFAFFVDDNGVDDPPGITLIEPAEDMLTGGDHVLIRWEDSDPDSNAQISLYYDTDTLGADGTLIVEGIEGDMDGSGDAYLWNISAVPDGTYYVYAVITDATTTTHAYSQAAVTIDRTPPTIQASLGPGTYTSSQSASLLAGEPADIYYTLDGSEPTTESNLYTSPIAITRTTTLKVMAEDRAGNRSDVLSVTYAVQPNILVNVKTSKGRALSGQKVYVFTAAGAYTGVNGTTAAQGFAHFNAQNFAPGNYKLRTDYLGEQFWSQVIRLPETALVNLMIEEETAAVAVVTGTGPAQGVKVYLFSGGGAYLGLNAVTNSEGRVLFDLPVGKTFKFRADILGSQYWSNPAVISGGRLNQVSLEAGGGLFVVTVQKAPESPMSGIKVYLFNAFNSYLGLSQVTAASGEVSFSVPGGTYRLRADYFGYQFWSTDHLVTKDTSVTLPVPHEPVEITVQGMYQAVPEPFVNVPVYLYTAAGSYVGQNLVTNSEGKVFFDLPYKPYKVRADYLSRQYWSEDFTWQDSVVEVPLADAEITVTGGGFPQQGVKVYVFSPAGSYLGLNLATDAQGKAMFRLPETSYKFRVDYQARQFWSQEELLTADQVNSVGISVGGGAFSVFVLKQTEEARPGLTCYAYTASGSYLGMVGTTDTSGRVSFDLAAGAYKFRVDLLGYQFWSEVVTIPPAMSLQMAIGEETVEVAVSTGSGPSQGVRVYLFSESNAYLGLYKVTDSAGKVSFGLPVGKGFKFRADILGRQYWSEAVTVTDGAVNHVYVDAGGGLLEVKLEKANGIPLTGIKTYLYAASGSYLGLSQVTDALGAVRFEVPEGAYDVRADYLGYQFWSTDSLVTEDSSVTLLIPHETVEIKVQGVYQDVTEAFANVPVYLFTAGGSYVGQKLVTNSEGKVLFDLPDRLYKVRADYLGRQFWSEVFQAQNTTVTIPRGLAQVHVSRAGVDVGGAKVYLFSEGGSYLGWYRITDSAGIGEFIIPSGSCKFRVDEGGRQYWTPVTDIVAGQVTLLAVNTN